MKWIQDHHPISKQKSSTFMLYQVSESDFFRTQLRSLSYLIGSWRRAPHSYFITKPLWSYSMLTQSWLAWRFYSPSEKYAQRSFITLRFDDATAGQKKYALPIMEKYGLKGVLAVPTSAIGKKLVIHNSYNRYVPIQSWREVHEFVRCGWEIASHSRHHRSQNNIWLRGPWAKLSENELHEEIVGSKEDLKANLGLTPKTIVVPGLTLTQNPLGKREVNLIIKHYKFFSVSLNDLNDIILNVPSKYMFGLWGIPIYPSPLLRPAIRKILSILLEKRGSWAILFFHDIGDNQQKKLLREKDLQMIVREILSHNNIEVVTFIEGAKECEDLM